jgi:hypothetical protein
MDEIFRWCTSRQDFNMVLMTVCRGSALLLGQSGSTDCSLVRLNNARRKWGCAQRGGPWMQPRRHAPSSESCILFLMI